MNWIILAATVLAMLASFVSLGYQPFKLKGKARWLWLFGIFGVNFWCVTALELFGCETLEGISGSLLVNLLSLMSITDLREKMVYHIHFYCLLGIGIVSAFIPSQDVFWMRFLVFGCALGIFWLLSRKRQDVGGIDLRSLSCLALYFPFSRWFETVLLTLFCAMIWGLAGIIIRKKNMKSEIPFLPFMLIGTLLEYTARCL